MRLIIVEDEQMIRKGIEKHVQWKNLGINEVYTAENAEIGLKICKEKQVEVVISDICMPGMNGIELCRQYREILPECQIIFISGYSEKEYLKAAISLGAVSYVDKPIELRELSAAVKKAVSNIYHGRQRFDGILCLLTFEKEERKGKLDLLNNFKLFCACILKFRKTVTDAAAMANKVKSVAKDNGCKAYLDFIGERSYVVLLCWKERMSDDYCILQRLWEKLRQELKEDLFFAGGSFTEHADLLYDSYGKAVQSLDTLAYKDWNNCICSEKPDAYYDGGMSIAEKATFQKAALNKNLPEIRKLLMGWKMYFLEMQTAMTFSVRNVYYTLHSILCSHEVDTKDKFWEKLDTINEMNDTLWGLVGRIDQKEIEKSNLYVEKTKKYMWSHLQEKELSIQILADEVHLTPAYLSSLFKKITGVTIGQYLMQVRLEKAQELLKNPEYKIYQISEMVGYEDSNYFGKMFRKQIGMLPKEYRDSVFSKG